MSGIVVFALIALVHNAASAPNVIKEYIPEKCGAEDAECIKKGAQVFLNKIAEGVPKFDIKAFDPVEIDDVKVNFDEEHFAEFKNVKITGFKEQEVLDFVAKKDTDTAKINVNLVADTTGFVKGEKEHSFPYKVKATVTGSAIYPKETKKHEDGKEYVILGEETITCEVEGSPEVTISDSDRTAVLTDPKLQPLKKYFEENIEETRKKVACAFFENGFKAVGSSMRKFFENVPTDEYYKQ